MDQTFSIGIIPKFDLNRLFALQAVIATGILGSKEPQSPAIERQTAFPVDEIEVDLMIGKLDQAPLAVKVVGDAAAEHSCLRYRSPPPGAYKVIPAELLSQQYQAEFDLGSIVLDQLGDLLHMLPGINSSDQRVRTGLPTIMLSELSVASPLVISSLKSWYVKRPSMSAAIIL